MENNFYKIAGLVLNVQGGGTTMKERMLKYMLPSSEKKECSCDIQITINKQDILPEYKGKGPVGITGRWQRAEEDDKLIFRILPGSEDVVMSSIKLEDNRGEIALLSPDDLPVEAQEADIRDYIYAGQAFANLVLLYNRLVLHSSCISCNGKAVVFSAPSGTGKSTHTTLWKENIPGTEFINDDTPVLWADKDEVYACGSPWSGKTDLNENVCYPLAAVVFLERGEKNEITPMDGREALARMLGETRKVAMDGAIHKAADLCIEILEKVPAYRLRCNLSPDAAEVAYKEIFG